MREQTIQFTPQNWEQIYVYFQSYTGVDLKDIPDKYEDYIFPTRDIMEKTAVVKLAYDEIAIVSNQDGVVTLENGDTLKGKLISKAYAGLDRVTLYVASVVNIDQILEENDDMMDQFFLDFWAVSMLSTTRSIISAQYNETLSAQGQKCTSIWCPGQGDFHLSNQKTLFSVLKPESMGVTLDKHNRILPLKSVSGTMGHMAVDQEETLISCDYCEFHETCPGYAGKKYQHLNSQRRLV